MSLADMCEVCQRAMDCRCTWPPTVSRADIRIASLEALARRLRDRLRDYQDGCNWCARCPSCLHACMPNEHLVHAADCPLAADLAAADELLGVET